MPDTARAAHEATMRGAFRSGRPDYGNRARVARRPEAFHVEPVSGPSDWRECRLCGAPMHWRPREQRRSKTTRHDGRGYVVARRQEGACERGHGAERNDCVPLSEAGR